MAQWIRRQSPKPKIGGSSPPSGTTNFDERGWSLCEIMDQVGAGFYKAGQQQRLPFPELKQDKMTISKKFAPQGLNF